MSFQSPQDWGPPWSTSRPPTYVTGHFAPEGVMAQEGAQGRFCVTFSGSEYETMAIDEAEFYSAGPEAQINDTSEYEVGMEVDLPSSSNDLMDVEMGDEMSHAAVLAMPLPVSYLEGPRTPRRPLQRAATTASKITEYFSPSKSYMARSKSILNAVTNTPRRNPVIPYTPQRTPRKPIATHPTLLPLFSDETSISRYPSITPRRKNLKARQAEELHPLFAELLTHEVHVITHRLGELHIVGADANAAKDADTVIDSASALSDVGSEATVVPFSGNLAVQMGLEIEGMQDADEFLKNVFKMIE